MSTEKSGFRRISGKNFLLLFKYLKFINLELFTLKNLTNNLLHFYSIKISFKFSNLVKCKNVRLEKKTN